MSRETRAGNRMAAWLGELIWSLPGLDETGRERMQALGNERIAAIEDEIAERVVSAIERVLTEQPLNTPLNREALVSVVRSAAYEAPR